MDTASKPSRFVLGLALFSMFFGSGNLIFSLFLGYLSQGYWYISLVGFLLTAVCLPLLGVVAMVMYEGHYRKFFDLLGRPWGFLLTVILLVVWIPLGSGPRCISLSFASLGTYLDIGSPWIYGAVYSALTCAIVLRKGGMLRILGSYLTPILLLCLAAVFVASFFAPSSFSVDADPNELFFTSIVEGYNTMDLIASFFFSASVIGILQKQGGGMSSNLKLMFQSGLIAAIILAVVYSGLLYSAAVHSAELSTVPKEQMLAHLAKITIGPHLGIIAALAIFLACLTTSVALTVVFADFLTESIFRSKKMYLISLSLTLIASYLMSITGLKGITAITSPALQICYPLLLLIIIWAVAKKCYRRKKIDKMAHVPDTFS